MDWHYDDGGRATSGFTGTTRDCVVRAIAIATMQSYRNVYDELKAAMGKGQSPRNGVPKSIYERYLLNRGWIWMPTMFVGSGCTTHLRRNDLPDDRLIVSVSRHYTAVINGVIRDTYDPSRNGTRCVYGYWRLPR